MAWHLALDVDRGSRVPLALQVRDAVRRLVEDGTLRPGTRLPSSRQLATDLGVSRSVVVEAYEQLTAEGYLVTRRGSGTSVAEDGGGLAPVSSALTAAAATSASAPVDGDGGEAAWDLRTGTSNLLAFPRQEWIRCVTVALGAAGHRELSYSPPAGVPLTRHILAGYLGRVRGVRTRSEDLMITSGFAQGLALLCRVLGDRGHRTLAVEDPGHPGEREFIASARIRPVGIPVDAEGIRVDLLEQSGARAVLTTPGHQFPTGACLSRARREQLIAWARAVDGYVIEDDYDNAYRSRSGQPSALQSLAPDRVVYAGSASKVLAPALRLGWLAAPSELMASLEHVRAGWDIGCSGLEQLAFARFIDSGGLDRHQRRLRAEFAGRREVVRREVARRLPGTRVLGGDGGLQAYLELPPAVDEDALIRAARGRSVLIRGGRFHTLTDTARPPALVLSYATVGCEGLARGIAELGVAYRRLLPGVEEGEAPPVPG
ncbi:PLP-dependent aminotransferase family protein [Kitasatospora purpeofusca]|uniref:MocR-like pyridoxine biosynthesis transcription factor PdxR n=1 Tax=Kitasatospora purpeofusca TaxID=67352 RepID=UPI003245AC72